MVLFWQYVHQCARVVRNFVAACDGRCCLQASDASNCAAAARALFVYSMTYQPHRSWAVDHDCLNVITQQGVMLDLDAWAGKGLEGDTALRSCGLFEFA